jgi:hypothetical protein
MNLERAPYLFALECFSDELEVPVECIIEALEICLNRNCSTYRGQYWLQKNGTAMGPKSSCSYADIVAEHIDRKVLESKVIYPELYDLGIIRFRDDIRSHCGGVLYRGCMRFSQI